MEQSIGGDGEGTVMFWTLSPYVYQDLMQRGSNSQEAIGKIFDWIVDDTEDKVIREQRRTYNLFDHVRVYESLLPFKLTHLGYDERMPTHLMARLLAKTISRNLS